jgi:hypothetical protein
VRVIGLTGVAHTTSCAYFHSAFGVFILGG